MNHLKVSARLTILIGVLSVLLVVLGGLGLLGIGQSNDALKSVYEQSTLPAVQLGHISSLVLHNRLAVYAALVSPTPENIQQRSAEVESNIAVISKEWAAYMTSQFAPEEAALAKGFVADRKAFMQEAMLPALAALRADDLKEAERLAAEKIGPLAVPMERGIEALVKIQVDDARRGYDEAAKRYAAIRAVSFAAIAGGLLFAMLFGSWMVGSITRELGGEPGQAAALARGVAAGDLSAGVALRAGDTTSLMAQLKEMQLRLAQVVGSVRANSESVATASAQIAQGNLDLSQRTEEQASVLEKTAAAMEELSSTVQQNADNASRANQLALNARNVAIQGGEVVGQVVDTMKAINDSSKRIADIIGVIDGIAFQTNILALNAAVEAARAGEQGRGFAVVASEVRSLAGRSADAAKEIKSLISASVERVEQGTVLVDHAGATMTDVVSSINRVTDIVSEISVASAEQSAGVVQVANAVSQMDQVTQQNAALVEESAAAAESLKSQAMELVQMVAVFKLAQQDPARHEAGADGFGAIVATAGGDVCT
jgi:methyl-accepting chemotaxis protein